MMHTVQFIRHDINTTQHSPIRSADNQSYFVPVISLKSEFIKDHIWNITRKMSTNKFNKLFPCICVVVQFFFKIDVSFSCVCPVIDDVFCHLWIAYCCHTNYLTTSSNQRL